MNSIEAALLASISHHAELHSQWRRLITQASPAASRSATVPHTTVASPRRTKIASWA